jgi:hypothetical protein
VHRENSIPRVRRWVNQIHDLQLAIAAAQGGLSVEPEKIRPIAGNDRPFLISPGGSAVEALGVWEGASTNGLGTVGGLGCAVHSMSDVLRDVQCRISTLTTSANYWGVSASGI